jgi:hypothetical protein
MFDWGAFLSAILGALAALGGVVLAQAAERRKSQEDRLWRERANVNVAVLDWVLAVTESKAAGQEEPKEPAALAARVQAFASERTMITFDMFKRSVSPFYEDKLSLGPYAYAESLKDAVRMDLQPSLKPSSERAPSAWVPFFRRIRRRQ